MSKVLKKIPFLLLCTNIVILFLFIISSNVPYSYAVYICIIYLVLLSIYIYKDNSTIKLFRNYDISFNYVLVLAFITSFIINEFNIFQSEILDYLLVLIQLLSILLSSVLLALHIKRKSPFYTDSIYSSRQERIIKLHANFKFAFEKCTQSLSNYQLQGWTVINESKGIISVRTYETSDGGDVIKFRLKRLDDENTEIAIQSHPYFLLGFDMSGRNYERIEEIVEYLRKS